MIFYLIEYAKFRLTHNLSKVFVMVNIFLTDKLFYAQGTNIFPFRAIFLLPKTI